MESFGSFLRTEREKKGIRLEEIASITKIHLRNLELMETDQWNELPPEPFIRGFITAYAKYVGIESKDALERYYVDTNRPKVVDSKLVTPVDTPQRVRIPDTPLTPPPGGPTVEAPRHFPAKAVFATLGILVVCGAIVGLIYVGKEQARTQAQNEGIDELTDSKALLDKDPRGVPPSPLSQQGAPTPAGAPALPEGKVPDERGIAASTPIPAPHPPLLSAQNAAPPLEVPKAIEPIPPVEARKVDSKNVEPERHPEAEKIPPPSTDVTAKTDPAAGSAPVTDGTGKPHEVVIENKHRTWIKVIIDDAAPTETILAEGQRTVYGASEKIKITLGNSSGSKVTYNGTEDGGTKFSGTIRYYKFPADAKFPQDKPKRKPKPQPTEAPAEAPGETSAEPPATSVIQ